MDRGIKPTRTPAQIAVALELLEGVDVGALDDQSVVEVVTLCERLKGAAAALQARASVHLIQRREGSDECRRGRPDRSVRAELALGRRCSPTVMDRHIGMAKALVREMPQTMSLLSSGRITERQAFHLVARTACLMLEDRVAVDELLAADLPGLSDRQTQGAAERAAAELDNAAIARRHSAAVRSRRIGISPAPDGMAWHGMASSGPWSTSSAPTPH